jgi:ABC-2 type transport system permease protein
MTGLVRYGFLGYEETDVALSLLFLTLATLAIFAFNMRVFVKGTKLRA